MLADAGLSAKQTAAMLGKIERAVQMQLAEEKKRQITMTEPAAGQGRFDAHLSLIERLLAIGFAEQVPTAGRQ